MTLRPHQVAGAEGEEGESAQRADVARVVAERLGPGVERRVSLAPIGMDAREEVMAGRELGIAGESAAHHRGRRVELAAAAKRLGQVEEYEASGLGGQSLSERADVVGHGAAFNPSAMMRAASRKRTTAAR